MVSGEDLKIVHSGQTATLEQINPLDRRKVLVDAYWLDGEEKCYQLEKEKKVTLYVLVKNARIGENITLTFETTSGNNQKQFKGTVGENGLITIQNFYL